MDIVRAVLEEPRIYGDMPEDFETFDGLLASGEDGIGKIE